MNPDRLAELEEERRFLLRSIGDLEREHAVGDVDEHDFATLRDGYVARAAAVLREIDEGKAAVPPRRRRPGVLAASIALTIAVAVLAGWAVAHYSGQRTDSGTAQLTPPDEISQQLAAARVAIAQGDSTGAVDAYKRVLELDPKNAEASTYAGWLIVLSGRQGNQPAVVDIGVEQLRRAIANDPTYPDAHCLLGVALSRFVATPDPVAAKAELTECVANDPPAEIRGLVQPVLDSLESASTTAG